MISKIWQKCNKCKEIKGVRDFSKKRSTPSGYAYTCKTCMKGYASTSKRIKRRRAYNQKRSLDLVDSYVRSAAASFFKCKASEVDKDFIPFFREKMKLWRLLNPKGFGYELK